MALDHDGSNHQRLRSNSKRRRRQTRRGGVFQAGDVLVVRASRGLGQAARAWPRRRPGCAGRPGSGPAAGGRAARAAGRDPDVGRGQQHVAPRDRVVAEERPRQRPRAYERDLSEAAARRARELDPLSPAIHTNLGVAWRTPVPPAAGLGLRRRRSPRGPGRDRGCARLAETGVRRAGDWRALAEGRPDLRSVAGAAALPGAAAQRGFAGLSRVKRASLMLP